MSDYPKVDPVATSTVNDFSSGRPTEYAVDGAPPSYEYLNPSVLGNTNNSNVKPTQYQPQPQWGAMGYVGSPQNMNGVPAMVMANPEINNIENYMAWSVVNILFCCLCLGFLGCYYSSETNDLKLRGDFQGALNASRNARTINIITTIIGIVINTVLVLRMTGTFY